MTQPDEREELLPASEQATIEEPATEDRAHADPVRLIDVYAEAPEDYEGTCLRPLGLCELGGSCDACWYNDTRQDSLGKRPKQG